MALIAGAAVAWELLLYFVSFTGRWAIADLDNNQLLLLKSIYNASRQQKCMYVAAIVSCCLYATSFL